jgi:hypothetical protein
VLCFLPPFIVTEKHVDVVVKALDAALADASLVASAPVAKVAMKKSNEGCGPVKATAGRSKQ